MFTIKSVTVAKDVYAWSKDLTLDLVLIDEKGKEGKARAKYEHAVRINYQTKSRVTIDKPYRWSEGDAQITSLSEAKGLRERIEEVAKQHIAAFTATSKERERIEAGDFKHSIQLVKNHSGDMTIVDRIKLIVKSASYAKHDVFGELVFNVGPSGYGETLNEDKEEVSFIYRDSNLTVNEGDEPSGSSEKWRKRLLEEQVIDFGKYAKKVVEDYVQREDYVAQLLDYRISQKERELRDSERDVSNAQHELEHARAKVRQHSNRVEVLKARREKMTQPA